MLSIALARADEQPILDQTATWLAADRQNHVFTLVVDELHMYRGTAGTEVAYLLRRLLRRLGLDQHPEQLSVVATSASLEDGEDGRRFVAEFFGRDTALHIESTTPVRGAGAATLERHDHLLEPGADASASSPDAADLQSAFHDATLRDGRPRAAAVDEVARHLFPGAEDAEERLEQLVQQLGQSSDPAVRLRVHLFFRTLQGVWACADPACTEVDERYRHDGRAVGGCTPDRCSAARAAAECWSCCTASRAARSCWVVSSRAQAHESFSSPRPQTSTGCLSGPSTSGRPPRTASTGRLAVPR